MSDFTRIAVQNIYFSFSEQILDTPSVIETVKPAEDETSNFIFFTRITLQKFFKMLINYLVAVLADSVVIEPVKPVEKVVGN